MSARKDEEKREKMKIEKAKQILERCANESAKLLIKNANQWRQTKAAAGFRLATALSMASLAMEKRPKAPVHRTPNQLLGEKCTKPDMPKSGRNGRFKN